MKLSSCLATAFLAALFIPMAANSAKAQNNLPPGSIVIPGNGERPHVVPRPQNNRIQRRSRNNRYRRSRAMQRNYTPRPNTLARRPNRPTGPPMKFVPGRVVSSAPALGGNGLVYFASWNNKIYALNATTGKKKWVFTAGKMFNSSPAVGANDIVYIGSYDHNVYALNGATGAKKWQFATGDFVNSAVAIGPKQTVYVGGRDHSLYALNSGTGKMKWTAKFSAAVSAPVVGSNGMVYCGADGVYAVDAKTGKVKWSAKSGIDPTSPVALGRDGTLYVGTSSGSLFALHGGAGAVKWRVKLPHGIAYPPLVAGGRLYVGSDNLYALRASNGRPIWQHGDGKTAWSAPVLSSTGTVYAGNSDGYVYGLSGRTGQVLWRFKTNDSLLSFPSLGKNGTVFVGCEGQSKAYAFNDRTGKVLWMFSEDPLPKTASAIAPVGNQK